MGDPEKDKSVQRKGGSKPRAQEQKKKSAKDKLREKLEKLKKDDPNIYPVF